MTIRTVQQADDIVVAIVGQYGQVKHTALFSKWDSVGTITEWIILSKPGAEDTIQIWGLSEVVDAPDGTEEVDNDGQES